MAAKKLVTKKAVTKVTKPTTQRQPTKRSEPEAEQPQGGLIFLGRLFPGEGNTVLQGTFEVAALHESIDQAAQDSVEPDKVRFKAFEVTRPDKSGNMPPNGTVSLAVVGKQRAPSGGRGFQRSQYQKPQWSNNNRGWR